MKSPSLKMVIAGFAVLGLAAGTLIAEEAEKGAAERKGRPGGQRGAEFRAKLLEKFDKNGDGKLDEQERAAAKAARGENGRPGGGRHSIADLIKNADKNGDGNLDKAEITAAQAMMKERREAFAKNNPEEAKKRQEERAKRKGAEGRRGAGGPFAHMLKAFDANKDGQLSAEELATAKTEMQKRRGGEGKGKGRPEGAKKRRGGKGADGKKPASEKSE